MNSELVVYTVIIGGFDILKPPLVVDPNTRYVCITDEPLPDVPPWEQRVVSGDYDNPRQQSRVYKSLSHLYIRAEYSLYIDGRIQLRIPPVEALGWLKDNDIALCRHPTDDCAYDEARKVMAWRLDDPDVVRSQMARYRVNGYPEHHGLAAGSVILRRHSDPVKAFNYRWWAEVTSWSARDQLSLNYCLWACGLDYDVIPGHLFHNPNFVYQEGHNGHNLQRVS